MIYFECELGVVEFVVGEVDGVGGFFVKFVFDLVFFDSVVYCQLFGLFLVDYCSCGCYFMVLNVVGVLVV